VEVGSGANQNRGNEYPLLSLADADQAGLIGHHRRVGHGTGTAENHRGAADAHHVAVVQAPAAHDALAVDERAVARQAVVDERPIPAHELELGVGPRDLRIPRQRESVVIGPADVDPVQVRERLQLQLAGAVLERQERSTLPLSLAQSRQL
jgi:hypothetical protein